MERIIGRHTEGKKGPLLIVFGGMHGNEPAGIKALEMMFKMLEVEPITNPNFEYFGAIVGIRGNLRALRDKQRFIVKDLNRQFTEENIERIKISKDADLDSEDREVKEILTQVEIEIETYQPEKIVFLDIHTTTAFGGIFAIPTDDPESLRIAIELHAPVITGLLEGINGTSLHYFNEKNYGRNAVTVVFESGQHDEPLSVNRAIAAITNCMRTIGSVRATDIENRHDEILIEYSKDLPKVAKLLDVHKIKDGDNFKMAPDFVNFKEVAKNQLLAWDKNGEIRASQDALILMPLYQKQGDDGFFLVQKVDY